MRKHASSPSPVKARLSVCAMGKIMSIIFCNTRGIVLNNLVPATSTVNSEYYAHLFWVPLQRAIRDKRSGLARSGISLHHNKAPVHVSQLVKTTFQMLGIKTLQTPYSPDLAKCDFFLFPNVRDQLHGIK